MLPAWARNQVGPAGVSSAPVTRENGNDRERYLSVSAQSCRNRGSRVQFCLGRVDCRSCLALAAQVDGGKPRARLYGRAFSLPSRRAQSVLHEGDTGEETGKSK